jgi:hypothetical protein
MPPNADASRATLSGEGQETRGQEEKKKKASKAVQQAVGVASRWSTQA